jgi:transcriptional regulator with XRE-family HTH domain
VAKKWRGIVHKLCKCDHKSSRCHHTITKNRSDFAEGERAMQDAPHPNKLRMLLAVAGLNQREAAHEAGIPEGTLRHYVAGEQVIPRRDRAKLAQVVGCDIQDLAPQYDAQEGRPKKLGLRNRMTGDRKPLLALESDGFFYFGKIKTALVVLDGNGTETYSPQNIRTFYDFRSMERRYLSPR